MDNPEVRRLIGEIPKPKVNEEDIRRITSNVSYQRLGNYYERSAQEQIQRLLNEPKDYKALANQEIQRITAQSQAPVLVTNNKQREIDASIKQTQELAQQTVNSIQRASMPNLSYVEKERYVMIPLLLLGGFLFYKFVV